MSASASRDAEGRRRNLLLLRGGQPGLAILRQVRRPDHVDPLQQGFLVEHVAGLGLLEVRRGIEADTRGAAGEAQGDDDDEGQELGGVRLDFSRSRV